MEAGGLDATLKLTAIVRLQPPQAARVETAPSASAGGGGSVADEIAKLAALRDKGILTQQEFQAQKAKVLGEAPI